MASPDKLPLDEPTIQVLSALRHSEQTPLELPQDEKRMEELSHLKETSIYTLQSDQDTDSQSKEFQKPMQESQLATSAIQSVTVPSAEESQLVPSASQSIMVPSKLRPLQVVVLFLVRVFPRFTRGRAGYYHYVIIAIPQKFALNGHYHSLFNTCRSVHTTLLRTLQHIQHCTSINKHSKDIATDIAHTA